MKKTWPLDTAVSFDPYFGEPNRDGDQGYEIRPDGTAFIRLKAPGAREVALDQFGRFADEHLRGLFIPHKLPAEPGDHIAAR